MRIRLDSVGCRLNIGEMDALARSFARAGHRIVGPGERADLVLFNTCAVTHVASRKSRKIIRQLRRSQPQARLVVTGCYAELSPAETASLGVDLVVANADKDAMLDLLEERGFVAPGEPLGAPDQDHLGQLPGQRTRAFLKVQDGCDNRCTFCIVTVARGDGRSTPEAQLVEDVQCLAQDGYQEVVLTGVHLGSYGHDRGRPQGLEELVSSLLRETDIPRLRLSSLEPWDLRPEFFGLWSDPRLLPHLHLPLQSGCDSTLARMARHTTQTDFAALLDAARAAIPELAISTDVIVGFPGECDAEFEESLEFVRAMEFSRLHVFRYSPRAGTAAFAMPDPVAPGAIAERAGRMHDLGATLEADFVKRYVGRQAEVLWETSEPRGEGLRWSGLTGNYIRVVTDTRPDRDLHNVLEPVVLENVQPGLVWGRSPSTWAEPDPTEQGMPALARQQEVGP